MNRRLVVPAAVFLALILSACNLANPQPPTQPTPDTMPTEAASIPTETTIPWEPPEHPIQVRDGENGAEFYHIGTGETFVPRGANRIELTWTGTHYEDRLLATDVWDPAGFRADMGALTARGYNTVRIFIDSCNAGPGCITNPTGRGLNGEYLDNMVEMMQIAKEEGIFLQLTSNDIPDDGGYGDLANREASGQIEGYRNAHMLTASGHEAARRYWEDLITGLIERQAPLDVVLGWQLLNEQWLFSDQPPLSLAEGRVQSTVTGETYDMADPDQRRDMVADSVLAYISTMTETIKTLDPTALVTMGFFAPRFPNPTGIGGSWYVDTAILLERGSALDYYDFHAYAGSDISFEAITENFGMIGFDDKPVVLGEYGAFTSQYAESGSAARVLAEMMSTACQSGYDGALLWTYRATPSDWSDNTWALTDEDGYLLDLFAPGAWPDPCVPIEIPTDNLALGAVVTASQSPLPAEPPPLAVDGDPGTQWGAGGGPYQWIEVDLGAGYTVRQVRLLVAQWPAGETDHEVSVAGPDRVFAPLTGFSGTTADGDWLEFSPAAPLEGIRYVRVQTLSGPSWVAWREIEVIGE